MYTGFKKESEQEDKEPNGSQSEDEKEEKKENMQKSPVVYFNADVWYKRYDQIEKINPEELQQLTVRDKEVIRETWPAMIDHLTDSGTRVFLQIFKLNTNIREVFHFARNNPEELEELVENEHMKRHSTQFMQAIKTSVEHLDELDKYVGPIFINLGKRHIHFKNLKEDYFQVFSGAMMWVWKEDLGDQLTPEVRTAWKRLFDYILAHLKFGYVLAKRSANK